GVVARSGFAPGGREGVRGAGAAERVLRRRSVASSFAPSSPVPPAVSVPPAPSGVVHRALLAYLARWREGPARSAAAGAELPSSVRPLVELQVGAQELLLQTSTLTKIADGIGGTVRRVQQLGGS